MITDQMLALSFLDDVRKAATLSGGQATKAAAVPIALQLGLVGQ